MSAIGKNARALRKAAGLTRDEMARRAKVSGATISNIESGRHIPSLTIAVALADALRVSLDDLAGRADFAICPECGGCGFVREEVGQ